MSGTGTRSEVSFLKTNRLLSEPSTKEELLSSIEKQKVPSNELITHTYENVELGILIISSLNLPNRTF